MNRLFRLCLLLCALAMLPITGTTVARAETASSIPSELRSGTFECDGATISTALELVRSGWMYSMPVPKSPQAAWGNRDGRTTWWIGYWINSKTQQTSLKQPVKVEGQYVGDNLGGRSWRRGGSPSTPTKIEWLCSKSGGLEPR